MDAVGAIQMRNGIHMVARIASIYDLSIFGSTMPGRTFMRRLTFEVSRVP